MSNLGNLKGVALANAIKELLETNDKLWEAIDGDGHSINDPAFYIELGWPEDFIAGSTVVHESDRSSYKGSIFDANGNFLDRLEGVDSLSFHRRIGALFGINAPAHISGRGSQARSIAGQLREKFGRVKTSV